MRALSLRCPFPWLVVNGYKPIENRSWNTKQRGWVLIHASKFYDAADLRLARELLERLGWRALSEPLRALTVHLVRGEVRTGQPWCYPGGIVGAVRLDGVLPPIKQGYGDPLPDWRIYDQYGYEIGATELLPFTPCSGRQGFWRVPFGLMRELEQKIPIWLWDELQKND